MSTPQVSIVVPLYNKIGTIGRCLDSVFKQNFSDWELLVVDDGSSDGCVQVVLGYADPRVRIIQQENSGVSVARNRGVSEARARWIAFLDADDEWLPEFLGLLFSAASSDYEIVMASANQLVGLGGRLSVTETMESGLQSYFKLCNGCKSPVHSSNCLIQRQVLAAIGGFTPGQKQFEDWTCWMKVACRGKFFFLNRTLSIYHADDQASASRQRRPVEDVRRDVMVLVDAGEGLLGEAEVDAECRGELRAYLNRFILRSACPFLLLNGGLKDCRALLRHVHWRSCDARNLFDLFFVARRYLRISLSSMVLKGGVHR
jgi:glycosyltransferase involved in cell wall biosynthesis